MPVGRKYDHPPLLAPGRHPMSLPEVNRRFVTAFGANERRTYLFGLLEEFIHTLLANDIACEVWLDGSFLSEKPDPSDLDVTVILEPEVAEELTEAQASLIDDIAERRFAQDVDSFAFAKLRRSDPDFGDDELDPAYSWGGQYGLECNETYLKGFVVLKVRETDVGLRICS